jgi:hypothetical protein
MSASSKTMNGALPPKLRWHFLDNADGMLDR